MPQKVRVMTHDGAVEYFVYVDNRELAADFCSAAVRTGDSVLYRGIICEVLGDFEDEDGERYCQLLAKGHVGGNFQFQIF